MWSGLAGLGGSFISNEFARKRASQQRAWSEEMSNTAHQREVRDLRAAGLNPILSAGGQGASTPGTSQAPVPKFGESFSRGVNSAQALQNIKSIKADVGIKNVTLSMRQDMLDFYRRNPKIRDAVMAAMLAKEVGISPQVGAIAGASSSAYEKAKEKLEMPLKKDPNNPFQWLQPKTKRVPLRK